MNYTDFFDSFIDYKKDVDGVSTNKKNIISNIHPLCAKLADHILKYFSHFLMKAGLDTLRKHAYSNILKTLPPKTKR